MAAGWIRRAIEEKLQRETGFSPLSGACGGGDTQLFRAIKYGMVEIWSPSIQIEPENRKRN